MNQENKKTEEQQIPLAEISTRLPPLGDSDIDRAEHEDNLEWASRIMTYYTGGNVHQATDLGITLQVVSRDTVRCIAVFDDEVCFHFLAMVKRTFQCAGFEIQVDPYTVVRPLQPKPADSPVFFDNVETSPSAPVTSLTSRNDGQTGMEVV